MARKIEGARRSDAFWFKPEAPHLTVIGVDTDHKTREDHPLCDPERRAMGVTAGLVDSAFAIGIKEAIEVRQEGPGLFVVVNGNRRVLAAREANIRRAAADMPLIEVPALISDMSDDDAFQTLVVTNEHRANDNDVTRARKAAWLLNQGKPRKYVAAQFDVSPATIAAWTRMLKAHPDVLAAVTEGKISSSVAAEIATLPRDEQPAKLLELIELNETSVRQARDNIRAGRSAGNLSDGEEGEGDEDGDGEGGEGEGEGGGKKKKKADDSDRPSLGLVREIIAFSTENIHNMSQETLAVLKWFVAEKHKPVAGLQAAVNAIDKAKSEKRIAAMARAKEKLAAAKKAAAEK